MATHFSRFDLLNDDAHDPFEKKKKASKPSTSQTQKKGAAKNSGGQGHGQTTAKKSKKKNTNASTTNNEVSTSRNLAQEEFPELGSSPPAEIRIGSNETNRINQTQAKLAREKRTKDQWSEWTKRDEEFVTDSYKTDLEEALLQSKLVYEDEQEKSKSKSSKKSKKKVTVPLPEFNNFGKGDSFDTLSSDPSPALNGFCDGGQSLHHDEDDPRLVQLRHETQQEMLRQGQIDIERKLINSRNLILPVPFDKTREEFNSVAYNEVVIQKDKEIAQLKEDKLALQQELEVLKSRFKKICSVLGDAQLKDKAGLVVDLEKVSKLNQDMNEDVQELHSQLEQERSKNHAALLEIRKLTEQSRRRNPHSESVAQ